jgi:hypothetical protein
MVTRNGIGLLFMSGKSKQDKKKAELRATDMSLDPPPPQWAAARQLDDGVTDEEVFPVWRAEGEQEVQIVQRVVRDPGTNRIRDFAVMIQVWDPDTDDAWCDLERIDCAHDMVHIDRVLSNGEVVKDVTSVPTDCRDNLDRAYDWALTYIWSIEERLA